MALLITHLAAVWFLVGLAWVVQGLVYPGFVAVGPALRAEDWARHHGRHTRAMAFVVTPAWALQGVTCAILLFARPDGVPLVLALLAAAAGAATVGVTVGISVPCHRRLAAGYDAAVALRLLRTDRWRTLAWSAAGVVAVLMVVAAW